MFSPGISGCAVGSDLGVGGGHPRGVSASRGLLPASVALSPGGYTLRPAKVSPNAIRMVRHPTTPCLPRERPGRYYPPGIGAPKGSGIHEPSEAVTDSLINLHSLSLSSLYGSSTRHH